MRVLIILNKSPTERYLVDLYNKTLIREVRKLINANQYHKAITAAFTKGALLKEVFDDEVHSVNAGLILTESTANWDLVRR